VSRNVTIRPDARWHGRLMDVYQPPGGDQEHEGPLQSIRGARSGRGASDGREL